MPSLPACDVVIVGAGYTGLSAALTLARAGRSVQVFDRMRPGEGASTRNGGIASGNLRPTYDERSRISASSAPRPSRSRPRRRARIWPISSARGHRLRFRHDGALFRRLQSDDYERLAREADL